MEGFPLHFFHIFLYDGTEAEALSLTVFQGIRPDLPDALVFRGKFIYNICLKGRMA